MAVTEVLGQLQWRLSWASDQEVEALARALGLHSGLLRIEDVAKLARMDPEGLFIRRDCGSRMLALDADGVCIWAARERRDWPSLVGLDASAAAPELDIADHHMVALFSTVDRGEATAIAWGSEQRTTYPLSNGGALLVVSPLGS